MKRLISSLYLQFDLVFVLFTPTLTLELIECQSFSNTTYHLHLKLGPTKNIACELKGLKMQLFFKISIEKQIILILSVDLSS